MTPNVIFYLSPRRTPQSRRSISKNTPLRLRSAHTPARAPGASVGTTLAPSASTVCPSGARKSFVRIIGKPTKALSTIDDLIVPFGNKFRLEPRATLGREAESAFDRHSLSDVLEPHCARQLLGLAEPRNQGYIPGL